MKPARKQRKAEDAYVYTTPELRAKLRNIMQQTQFIFKNGKNCSPDSLAQFLYKINFITARKLVDSDTGEVQRKYFEENRYLSSNFVDFGYDWEVHPAFRWALQPDDINDVFQRISLYSD